MRIWKTLVCVTCVCVASATLPATALLEDFSSWPTGGCLTDGHSIGSWTSVYDGYGCSGAVSLSGNTVAVQQPYASTAPDETHASLFVGPSIAGDFTLSASVVTERQLRTGSAPNPWEAAWLIWHYTDDTHFYYFVPKPNGWELGKADPAYPGAQRFLATGSAPTFPVGQWYRIKVTQVGSTIQVVVNDLLITTFNDSERPYLSGRVGLYNEDASVAFDDVLIDGVRTVTKGKGRKR
jgi:hypothetical protein